ncbi:MAG: hypothetical protein JJT95_15505 [Pararhodobacter sp.]|nr:hypothetical protein [Pararhodobacter sp.]
MAPSLPVILPCRAATVSREAGESSFSENLIMPSRSVVYHGLQGNPQGTLTP